MKTRNTLPVSMLWLMLCLIFGIQISSAQNTSSDAAQGEPVLSGSNQKTEDILSKADAIFVGEIMQIGFGNTKETGRSAYHGVQVKVLKTLRGSASGQVSVTLRTTYAANERPPKVGTTYIFIAHKDTEPGWDNYTVLKLLPATNDDIAKVQALIAATPAGK